LIRDRRHLDNVVEYVVSNPVRAGLKDWPWVEKFDVAAVLEK
jgi:hypothetical protein